MNHAGLVSTGPQVVFGLVWYVPNVPLHTVSFSGRREPLDQYYPTMPRIRRQLREGDKGQLAVYSDHAEFTGKKGRLMIAAVTSVSFLDLGWASRWAAVEYADRQVAHFMDFRWRGWRGLLGGTREIYEALKRLQALEGSAGVETVET